MRGGVSYEMTTTCVQGGIRPLGGYQPNMMIEPSSPASAWQFHQVIPKREPAEQEERHDSGIASSGSDFVSSSPGSDLSENFNYSTNNFVYRQNMYNETIQNIQKPDAVVPNVPMTPPTDDSNQTHSDNIDHDDPLRKLQMSLEKSGFLPSALSPKLSECSVEDDNKSDVEEYDEQGLRIPKVNSHGKVKTFKCKQCDFVAITKLDFWEHTKSHIKADKLLTCPKCPFVTEYKHHLEYHLRNHFGSKPFKCNKCSYSCVNKSMLNSHLKSHSNVYQYRCSDCSYATKYCHSLKLHLRKYNHKPAMVLNPDGTPNPLPIIDVYGTRRGPKVKTQESKSQEEKPPKQEQIIPFPLNQFMLNSPPQMPMPFPGFPFFTGFPGAIPNPLLLQNLEKFARERQNSEELSMENENGVLDLSKPDESEKMSYSKMSHTDSNHSEDEDDEDCSTTMFSNVEVVENKEDSEEVKQESNNNKEEFNCQYCKINFGDAVLYTMHMGYHGYQNPFTCNMCGEECKDKVSFFLHIARTPHS